MSSPKRPLVYLEFSFSAVSDATTSENSNYGKTTNYTSDKSYLMYIKISDLEGKKRDCLYDELAGLLMYVVFTTCANLENILAIYNVKQQVSGNTCLSPTKLQTIRFRNNLEASTRSKIDSIDATAAQQTLLSTFRDELRPYVELGKQGLTKLFTYKDWSAKVTKMMVDAVINQTHVDRVVKKLAEDGAILFENKNLYFVNSTRMWFAQIQPWIREYAVRLLKRQKYELQQHAVSYVNHRVEHDDDVGDDGDDANDADDDYDDKFYEQKTRKKKTKRKFNEITKKDVAERTSKWQNF